MSIVYVPHPTEYDSGPAERWGVLKFINNRYIYGDELDEEGRLPSGFRLAMERTARIFRPHLDYLLIAGDHLQLCYICSELSRFHSGFRVLRFDREARGYIPALIGTIVKGTEPVQT